MAFEASLYIEWILKDKKRAKYYYVSNLRHSRVWALRAIEGTKEKKDFEHVEKYLKINPVTQNPDTVEEAQNHIKEIDKILSQNSLNEINKEFSDCKKTFEPFWYEPLGIKSIRKIANDIGRLAEYDLFYSIGSQVTHSNSSSDHIRFSGGKLYFKPIRCLKNIDTVFRQIISFTLRTYHLIIKEYRAGELPNFGRKYVEKWQKPFNSIKSVEYKDPKETVEI